MPAIDPRPPAPPTGPSEPGTAAPVAAIDIGASQFRLVVAEIVPGQAPRILEEAARGVLLGKDTFSQGRLGAATIEAALRALGGFRRIMDGYGVQRFRAVATSAVREAANMESFLDRVRLRTGIEVEPIGGAEENRLTYMAVRETLRGHEALTSGEALLIEVGGGSADISFLRRGEPVISGTYALGSIRMRQSLASWRGTHERRMRLLRRHIHNVVGDIAHELPLKEARHFIALGGDVRFAASRLLGGNGSASGAQIVPREAFLAFCDQAAAYDVDQIAETYHLLPAEAETLVPALLAYRELLAETPATELTIPQASLRLGLLLDLAGADPGPAMEDLRRQVLASAAALGEKYRYDAAHGRNVAHLAVRLFDDLRPDHGLAERERLLLEVAALLHDVGIFLNLRGHHKHTQYVLSAAEIFGLSREDMAVVSNVARYHRRGIPQKSHLPYTSLDRDQRVEVNKLAAILRVANALDADHLQKVQEVRVVREADGWVFELDGAGDLTMERLAGGARSDLFVEVFGQRISFREAGGPA